MPNAPVRVAVTGAAGQIGYSLLFRIASGEMFGSDQPVILQLLEIPDEKAQKALKGVMMEIDDCAFPLLHSMVPASDPMVAFKDVDVALLVGARPRGPGMERKDLLEANGKIFAPQGKALDRVAKRDVRVLVVGNPANTNCLIAMKNAKSLKPTQFTAIIPTVQKRGAAIIEARGLSSAASAANAAIDHMRDWALGTGSKWVTMGVPSNGEYGIPKDVMFGYPVTCAGGDYKIIEGLPIDAFSQERINLTLKELQEEQEGVKHLL